MVDRSGHRAQVGAACHAISAHPAKAGVAKPRVLVSSTAGGVVITGDMDGRLIVLDAQSGRVVHEADTGGPSGAGIVTYEVGGRQYIAVAGGSISPIWPLPPATSRVTIFRLR